MPDHGVHPDPGLFHLGMPVFRQVSRRPGFLGAERGPDVVDLLHREDEGLRVELPRLRQKGLATEVVDLEEGRAALAARRRDHRRLDLPETVFAEVFVDGAEDRVTDAEDARHLLRTDPQMPDVEEELFAQVFLDRELLREVDDPEVVRLDLIPPGGPLVGDDFSVDDHRGLDQRLLCGLKCFGRYGIPRDRRLKDPRRVPDDDEGLPPDRPGPVDPASQLDDFAGVASFEDFSDGDHEPQSHPAGSRLHFRGSPASEKSDSPPIRGRCSDPTPGSKRTTTPGAVRASDVARRGAGRPR